ncbi:CD1375 family protein [Desemzia sp. FAM 23991]|nr:Uncharacterised protein [Mycobacteroides abscessus subsp. abscessus]
MVAVYVNLIDKKLWSITNVPDRWKEEVREKCREKGIEIEE